MSHEEASSLCLYTYYRSSCSARLRIALALKQLPYNQVTVNILQDAHKQSSYVNLNPSQSVPTLIVSSHGSERADDFPITQSIAALEYLDEAFPTTHNLLPARDSIKERAIVRILCGIVAADVQPLTNMRTLKRVKALAAAAGKDADETANSWARELMTDGLTAYERVCKDVAGKYSVGDTITMADCCLVPAVWGAQRYGVDFGQLPTLMRVFEALSQEDCVKVSHWKSQTDTPEDLRA